MSIGCGCPLIKYYVFDVRWGCPAGIYNTYQRVSLNVTLQAHVKFVLLLSREVGEIKTTISWN